MRERRKHTQDATPVLGEVALHQGSGLDEVEHETIDDRPTRLHEVEHHRVAALHVSVEEPEAWIEAYGQTGQPALGFEQPVSVVEQSVGRVGRRPCGPNVHGRAPAFEGPPVVRHPGHVLAHEGHVDARPSVPVDVGGDRLDMPDLLQRLSRVQLVTEPEDGVDGIEVSDAALGDRCLAVQLETDQVARRLQARWGRHRERLRPPQPRVVVADSTGREMQLAAERVEHDDADPGSSAPPERVESDRPGRRQDDEARQAVGGSRVTALSAMGPEAVGDDKSTSVDRDPDAKAVGDTDSRVRRVSRERLSDTRLQRVAVVIALACWWY